VGKESIYSSKRKLLQILGIRENFLYKDFSAKYKEKEIPKKNGTVRIIKPPIFSLKIIQRKILDNILSKNTQLPCVYGLSKNKGIINNGKAHQRNTRFQLVVLDIENFFPSISKERINKVFRKIGFNKENSSILTKFCTIEESLPQGAPTSPYLASMVCEKMDKEIYTYCSRRGFIYTRYFDDISISGENILSKYIKKIEEIIFKNGFSSNKDKKYFFDNGTEKIINGIIINQDNLSVSNNYKKEIEDIYRRLIKGDSPQDRRIFAGKFGFYLHVNKKEALFFLENLKRNQGNKNTY
jgi:hypothetical protein